MTALTGLDSNITYKDLLQMGSGVGTGITGTLVSVEDGKGTNSALQISTSAVNINGAFSIGGTAFPTFPIVLGGPLTTGGTVNIGSTLTTVGAFTTAGAVTFSGAFTTTLNVTSNTNITLPISGTLATLAGSEALSNKLYNGLSITAGTNAALVAVAAKTLTYNNTLTLAGTDGSTITLGAGGTVAYTSNNLGVFAATTSAQFAGVISDATGTGKVVFATTPTLVTPILGVATATSINGSTVPSSVTLAATNQLKSILMFSTPIAGFAQNTTNFVGVGKNSTLEADVEFIIPFPCIISNMYTIANAAPASGQTYTYTIRKNGTTDTAITSQATSAGGTISSDLTHSQAYSAGDLICVKVVMSATSGSAQHTISVQVLAV